MGVVWDSGPSLGASENGLRMTSRMRLRLNFERQTDSGLAFGGTIRVDETQRRLRGGSVHIGTPDRQRNILRD